MATEPILPPWGVPPEKMAASRQVVRRLFTEEWLAETPAYAPVQKLWQYDDAQSSLEIHWLGTAVATLEAIDAAWLNHQLKQARGRDANNRRGAIFEILGLAMFADNHQLVPAPPNTRGYDGHVEFADARVLLSLKNLGRSRFARDVQKHGVETLKCLTKAAREQGLNWVGFVIEASCYPKDHEWLELQKVLCASVWRCASTPGFGRRLPPWTLYAMDAPTEASPISPAHVSNQLCIIVPHHPNELKTYESKLEEQALQVERQLRDHGAASAVLLAAVDDTVSIPQLSVWARDFISRRPTGPIDEIFFYQPSWLIDPNATTLSHYQWRLAREGLRRPNLNLTIPAGKVLATPSYITFPVDGRRLEHAYLFQSGDIYNFLDIAGGLPAEGNFGVRAPDVRTHLVMGGEGEYAVLGVNAAGRSTISLFT